MARTVARNAGVALDGQNISARSNTAALSITSEAPEITSFTETTRTRATGGLGDVELTVDGFWDSAASQVDAMFSSYLGGSGWWGFYPQGTTASYVGREFQGILTEYSMNAAVADAMTTSITVSGCSPLLTSKILEATTLVGAGASAATSSVDFGAALTGTAYAIVRIVSVAGVDPTISSCIQSSSDDTTFVTLSILTGSANGNTITVASLTNPLRYRRFKYIVTNGSSNVIVTCGSPLFV